MGFMVSLLILSFLIFFHELGHFLAARYFGVKVEVFSIGFGTKIYSKFYKGTEYCVSLIPLGGYVKMKGQDDLDPLKRSFEHDSYNHKTPCQRTIILLAGPFANFLLAFFLYVTVGFLGVHELLPKIGNIQEHSPAQSSGLQKNDLIIAINHQDVLTWKEVSELIKNSNSHLLFKIKRENQILDITVEPKTCDSESVFGEKIQKRMIGISPNGEIVTIQHDFLNSIVYGFNQTIEASKLIIIGIQKLIEGIVPVKEVGGVISIVKITSDASSIGMVALFTLTALISVNLGVLNLLPIPALDGGHVLFNIYEMIIKKAPSEAILYKMTIVGWMFLISLMLLGFYNDINRLLG